jgi:PleD family two-component response regulator
MEEGSRVLVVDDDDGVLRLFERALAPSFDVVVARDGMEARKYLEKNDVACLVADHMMPGLTGVDLCRDACTLRPHAARVLVTASERIEDAADAVNIGHVHRFLSKPVRTADLVSVVKEAVRMSQLERENARLIAELKEKNALLEHAVESMVDSERMLELVVQERTKELRRANAELEMLALRDGLTGLYNHRFFQEALATELVRATRYETPVSLIFLDVDHFKNYNDQCGHPAGDEVLRQLARLLSATD